MNYMKVENGVWTEPEIPSFANPDYSENCPVFSLTGDTLYFISTQSADWIFMTTKENNEWTEPEALDIPFPAGSDLGWQFSINRNGDIYFEIWEGNNGDLYCTRFENSSYQTPQILPEAINTDYFEFAPFIDPDDNFILFSSNRPGGFGYNDIYISSKDGNGNWTEAINLGATINSSNEEAFAFISYDHLYFFFTTQKAGDLGYNPYWVDADVIFDLVTDVNKEPTALLQEITMGNYPNPFSASTEIELQFSAISNQKDLELSIYNIKGQLVKSFPINSTSPQQLNSITWNETDISNNPVTSGIYYYKLNVLNSPINKMLLFK
nr:PD40 domain-containing protein [Bacteroidota bacterium]